MTTEPIRYYARQIYVESYPSNGSLEWCCLDSRGHYHVCRNEQSAVAEAMRRNAQINAQED